MAAGLGPPVQTVQYSDAKFVTQTLPVDPGSLCAGEFLLSLFCFFMSLKVYSKIT